LALAGAISPLEAQSYYDISRPAPALLGSASIYEAYTFSISPNTASEKGVFERIVTFEEPKSEGAPDKAGDSGLPDVARTFASLRSDLKSTIVDGVQYYSFGLGIKESSGDGKEYLSLSQLQVWVRNEPLKDAITPELLKGSGASQVYSLDKGKDLDEKASILLNYKIPSSGQVGVLFLIASAYIDKAAEDNWSIYLYSTLKDTGSLPGKDDHPEAGLGEWQTVSGLAVTPMPPVLEPAAVPEVSTWAAMIGMTGVAGLTLWRRSRRAQTVAAMN
jgi:hypothetical protein